MIERHDCKADRLVQFYLSAFSLAKLVLLVPRKDRYPLAKIAKRVEIDELLLRLLPFLFDFDKFLLSYFPSDVCSVPCRFIGSWHIRNRESILSFVLGLSWKNSNLRKSFLIRKSLTPLFLLLLLHFKSVYSLLCLLIALLHRWGQQRTPLYFSQPAMTVCLYFSRASDRSSPTKWK